jgi:hypothetical protein
MGGTPSNLARGSAAVVNALRVGWTAVDGTQRCDGFGLPAGVHRPVRLLVCVAGDDPTVLSLSALSSVTPRWPLGECRARKSQIL